MLLRTLQKTGFRIQLLLTLDVKTLLSRLFEGRFRAKKNLAVEIIDTNKCRQVQEVPEEAGLPGRTISKRTRQSSRPNGLVLIGWIRLLQTTKSHLIQRKRSLPLLERVPHTRQSLLLNFRAKVL